MSEKNITELIDKAHRLASQHGGWALLSLWCHENGYNFNDLELAIEQTKNLLPMEW